MGSGVSALRDKASKVILNDFYELRDSSLMMNWLKNASKADFTHLKP